MPDNVHSIGTQLSLDAGGATVGQSRIGSVKFAAGERDLEGEYKKGSNVVLLVTCRVTDVKFSDKYDAHGNVAETARKHDLRIDHLEVQSATPDAFTTPPPDPAPAGGDPEE